ncbi:Type I inositol 1,4,5-trisphosphate 5-phosphatase CVP2 [Hibiscus syriacus]|uniref:Type I inositol 1,4,5-trisphosphate 5-phosphatase CVP2 n=1 Tax=Hibiscus syriacus TaxID=106335 RepID=A0A6A2WMQ6_HIBSY|nr:Type I inositol 1,4,5-trisphosphate 5-phosphatase CVP2 [Hibiscus syriacus]
MRGGNNKSSKLSWKTLVKKWFNIKSKAEDFDADDVDYRGVDEGRRHQFSEKEPCTIKKSRAERSSKRYSHQAGQGKTDIDGSQFTDVHNYRIFVATWNVAGKSPPSYLNLQDWLHTSPPADVYVLGFQEIVPLNAGNVLGTENNGPARKWLTLIRKTLNSLPGSSGCCHTPSPIPDPLVELDSDFEGSTSQKVSSFFHRRSFQFLSRNMEMDNDMAMPQPQLDRRFSVCDRVIFGHRPSDCDTNFRWGSSDDENGPGDSPGNTQYSPTTYGRSFAMEETNRQMGHSRYCLVSSKQMVGIFLTVWVKSDLRDNVRNMKVSCVGRGLMGYLGNKGSISISMSLHQTSFCFVCSHLTSGQKEGDELRRNSDFMEILRKTRFPRVHGIEDENSPQTILEHDRIILLGDLNYRIALSYRSAKALVEMRNWKALLENDQALPGSRLKSCCHSHTDIPNSVSFERIFNNSYFHAVTHGNRNRIKCAFVQGYHDESVIRIHSGILTVLSFATTYSFNVNSVPIGLVSRKKRFSIGLTSQKLNSQHFKETSITWQ